jgi:NitT/TauT family transport system ATP-binding protein
MITPFQRLRELVAGLRWDFAAEMLRLQNPDEAARLVAGLPFERQRHLLRRLPRDLAGAILGRFPYFHAYALLYTLPSQEIAAIVNAMSPAQMSEFLDALPEEAWQHVTKALAGKETEIIVPDPDTVEAETVEEPLPEAQAAEAPPVIEARQIEKWYLQPEGRQIQVVGKTDVSIRTDTITALLGPSGSGKSTILRMLSGLIPPSGGEILWHGQPFQTAHPNVAIVFQSFALFPWLTVLENVETPLLAKGVARAERRRRAVKALGSVGLKGFESAYPKELSGGMKQRVGFARALAVEPEVLFMDEPFSALDVLTAENLRRELMELWTEKKVSTRCIFLVTHNIEEAVLLADRVIVLGSNPATVRADFTIPLAQPRDRKAAAFLLYVDYIYKVMTQPQLELAPPIPAAAQAKRKWQSLPHTRPGSIAGLLELLIDHGGEEDLYHVAEQLLLEVDDLFPIVEGATLLGFAIAHEGDVKITLEGRAFAEADIAERQLLFRDAVLARVELLQKIKSALESRSDRVMPLEFFHDILDEHFTEDEVLKQLDTALNWGRYAEIFNYSPEDGTLRLQQGPESESATVDQ